VQNARGGVNGHKLQLITKDDQSSPSQNTTASQELVQTDGVFGVIKFSSFTFAAAPYLITGSRPLLDEVNVAR
jgi:ABC-type branched-subunit amino acid transport system substrate-binding protein